MVVKENLGRKKKRKKKKYPDGGSAKSDIANFRRACKKFNLVNGQTMYKSNRFVTVDEQCPRDIMHNVYQGLGDYVKAVALSSHLGRTSTYQKNNSSFLLVHQKLY